MARRRRRFRLKPAGYAVVGVLLLVIGLCIYAIVRAIVNRNRGEINVESVLGKGTTFTVSFPIFDTEVDRE